MSRNAKALTALILLAIAAIVIKVQSDARLMQELEQKRTEVVSQLTTLQSQLDDLQSSESRLTSAISSKERTAALDKLMSDIAKAATKNVTQQEKDYYVDKAEESAAALAEAKAQLKAVQGDIEATSSKIAALQQQKNELDEQLSSQ